jgi:lipoprotein-releasing system permease protein
MSALAVRGEASRSVTLTGVDPDVYFRTITIPAYIVVGQPRLTADDILIGTELATDLGVGVNDKISVSAASGASRVLTITGIFDLGSKSANERNTYTALRTAQALSGLIGGVTEIDVTVADVFIAENIAQAI